MIIKTDFTGSNYLSAIFKKTAKLKMIIFMAMINFFAFFPFSVEAQITGLTKKPLVQIINNITVWLLGIAASLAILFIVVGGIYYVTAAGDERRIDTAKSIITYAIYGIFLVAIAYAIVLTVNKIVG